MSKAHKISLGLLIAILILSILSIVAFMSLNLGNLLRKKTGFINTNQVSLPEMPPLPPEPEILNSRLGKIITINEDNLEIELQVRNKEGGLSPRMAKVNINEKTKYLKTLIPKNPPLPPAPGEPPIKFLQKEIKLSDLKPEEIVIVTSEENIKDKLEFMASEINLEITE